MNEANQREYANNPQYLIEPMDDMEFYISLGQYDGRLKFKKERGDPEPEFEADKGFNYVKYPF